ncbi:MAG: 3-dehydroquinate synthase, partial [Oscillospiraceae bacterium]|nr:3-dehydroquinate synthase [Oscillospiraceae bacterium]
EKSLREAGYATARFVFPHGERSKNMETYTSLLSALAEANLTRSDVLAALGGGVAGDMAGFAAATYLRGIPFAQIPTTLLAMVDSSVGGKTAVDLPTGKNQAGAFYQPDIVICDYGALQTLPLEIFNDGCAEMIKHGVILSAELFELLKEPVLPLMDVIARNIEIKRDIVAADEKDTGIRQILNFGHTIGHGIEKHSGYGVSHGKAVAAGMVLASRGAWRLGLCGEECHREIAGAVRRFQLPGQTDISPEQLIEAAFFDKKRQGERITLILPERIGKCVTKSFSLDDLAAFIRLAMRP